MLATQGRFQQVVSPIIEDNPDVLSQFGISASKTISHVFFRPDGTLVDTEGIAWTRNGSTSIVGSETASACPSGARGFSDANYYSAPASALSTSAPFLVAVIWSATDVTGNPTIVSSWDGTQNNWIIDINGGQARALTTSSGPVSPAGSTTIDTVNLTMAYFNGATGYIWQNSYPYLATAATTTQGTAVPTIGRRGQTTFPFTNGTIYELFLNNSTPPAGALGLNGFRDYIMARL